MNKKILLLCLIILCSVNTTTAKASVLIENSYIEKDEVENNQYLLDSKKVKKNGRTIITRVYKQDNGTLITDTLNIGNVSIKSKNGTDTVTRTRDIQKWGTITMTAKFTWRTQGRTSYVKCDSMSASYNLQPNVAVKTWETSRTDKDVSIGKAKAQVEYSFYNTKVKFQHQKGTFKITCTDSGTISDNN